MNDILIINLRRFGDILSSAHLIESLAAQNPNARISVLVYSEFERIAHTLKKVQCVYTIDRKQILTLFNNDIFPDAMALEEFYQALRTVKNTAWKKIINYSNDPVSTNIVSYLVHGQSQATYHGLKFNEFNIATPSNDWVTVFNDILTCYPFTPIHFVDCYHQMAEADRTPIKDILHFEPDYETLVSNNFAQIREKHTRTGKALKIIGIQLKTSEAAKDIPVEVLVEVIDQILDHPDYYPVLLIAPNQQEKDLANTINKNFMNSLVTIESDFVAATSVVKNLDALVTPDTVIKHVADLVNTRMLELAIGPAPFLKQGTCRNGNLILRAPVTISSREIMECLHYLLDGSVHELPRTAPGNVLYRSSQDNLGTVYIPLAGQSWDADLSLTLARKTLAALMDVHQEIPERIFQYPLSQLNEWIEEEKTAINESTKALLASLRSLLRIQDNPKMGFEFTEGLEKIMCFAEQDYLCSMASLVFKSKIESITRGGLEENIRRIEALLYALRDDLQTTLTCLREMEGKIDTIKKERFTSRLVKTGNTPESDTNV